MLKIHFSGFWQFFDKTQIIKLFDYFPDKKNIVETSYEDSNIVFEGNWITNKELLSYNDKSKLYIVFSRENLYKLNYNRIINFHENIMKNNNYNILYICLNKISNIDYVFYPYWLNDFEDILNYKFKTSYNERYKESCCMWKNEDTKRKIFRILTKSKLINTNFKNSILLKYDDKIKTIEQYLFNLCPENSKDPEGLYITEKIGHAIKAGCIPIYWGGNIEKYTPFNTNRIIQINDINKDYNKLLKITKKENENEFKDMFFLPILKDNWKEIKEETEYNLKTMIEKHINYLN